VKGVTDNERQSGQPLTCSSAVGTGDEFKIEDYQSDPSKVSIFSMSNQKYCSIITDSKPVMSVMECNSNAAFPFEATPHADGLVSLKSTTGPTSNQFLSWDQETPLQLIWKNVQVQKTGCNGRWYSAANWNEFSGHQLEWQWQWWWWVFKFWRLTDNVDGQQTWGFSWGWGGNPTLYALRCQSYSNYYATEQQQQNTQRLEDVVHAEGTSIGTTEKFATEFLRVADVAELSLQNKPVSQSSGNNGDAWGGVPQRAVDGNTNGNYGGNSCTHTHNQDRPWWRVDLQQDNTGVERVQIWNRADCCGNRLSNFEVRIGNADNWQQNSKCGNTYSIPQSGNMAINCGGSSGRYVFIVIQGQNYLTLCEVKIFGPATTRI